MNYIGLLDCEFRLGNRTGSGLDTQTSRLCIVSGQGGGDVPEFGKCTNFEIQNCLGMYKLRE